MKNETAKHATMNTKRFRSAWSDEVLGGADAILAMRPIWQFAPTATTRAVPEPSTTEAPMKAMQRASREFLNAVCGSDSNLTGSASPVSIELSTLRVCTPTMRTSAGTCTGEALNDSEASFSQ